MKIALTVATLFASSFASAASFLNPTTSSIFTTAEMTIQSAVISSSSGGPAGSLSLDSSNVSQTTQNGLTYQFEFGDSGNLGNAIDWLVLVSQTGQQNKVGIGGDYSFAAQAGYQITSIYAAMGGVYWISGSGSFSPSVALAVNGSVELDEIAIQSFPAGSELAWNKSSPTYNFSTPRTSISGNFNFSILENPQLDFDANGNPTNSITAVLGRPTGASSGPSLFVTVEQITSPIPEPSEWAMMLAGLALVSAIAKRRAQQ